MKPPKEDRTLWWLWMMLLAGVVLAGAAAFACFVWPTPYEYTDAFIAPARIHRITGEGEVLVPGRGWVSVEQLDKILSAP